MKKFKEFLDEVKTLRTQYHADHPEHEAEVTRASKELDMHPDAVKKLISNFNSVKIHWDQDKKKEQDAAALAQDKGNTIKHSKHIPPKPKSPAVIAMKKFREGLKKEDIDEAMTPEYGKGYEHGFAGTKPQQDDEAYMRGHKSGRLSRSMKPNKAR
jgi:hypothetical protein